MSRLDRREYAALYGPTLGDRLRLADTDLWIEVEGDRTIRGEELKFGAGQVVRDGMGQGQQFGVEIVDLVITNALVLDHWGIVKADIGILGGRIKAIGNAGNPDIQPDVDIVIGPRTDVIAGEGMIVTAGAVDSHLAFLSPEQVEIGLLSGVTTMLGGGTGAALSGHVSAATPGSWGLHRMLQAVDVLPVNIGLLAKGSSSRKEGIVEQMAAGAMGLMLHPAWGVTPAAVDTCLEVAEIHDVQVTLQLDGRREAGSIDYLLAGLKHRVVNSLHGVGADGSDSFEALKGCGLAHMLPTSTHIERPPSSIRFGAEEILHDMGALSVVASDSFVSGRAGDLITRVWQMAHEMKRQRGAFPEDSDRNDNMRVRRYLAKYTINPALVHGIGRDVGSVEAGKLADLVLWRPAFFGIKPALVIKGGVVVAAPIGEANASRPDAQPVRQRTLFGALGRAVGESSVAFVSLAAHRAGIGERLGLAKPTVVATDCRDLRKADLIHNNRQPAMEIDPETGAVRAGGELLRCEPVNERPLAQRYQLF